MKKIFLFACMLTAAGAYAQSGSYKLLFNPKGGDKYSVVTKSTSKIAQNVMGQDMTINMAHDINMSYDIANAGANKSVTITYDQLKMNVDAMGQNIVMDSENTDTTKKENAAFRNLKGSSVTVTLQPDGKVVAIKGAAEMLEKMGSGMEKETLKGLFGDDAIQTVMQQTFGFYSQNPIKVGDSWKVAGEIKSPYKMSSNTTYTLKNVTGNQGVIDFVSTLSTNGSQKIQYSGMEVGLDLTGDITGSMNVDMETGMPLTSNMEQKLKGNVEAGGQKIPMALTSDIKAITTKK